MKKIFVFFCCFAAMFLMIGCGSGGSSSNNNSSEKNTGELGGECYPNKSCNEGLICDEESHLCVEDSENPTEPTVEPTDDPTNPTEPTDPTTEPSDPTDNPNDEPTNPTTEPTPDDDADTSDPEPDEDTDTIPVSDEDADNPEQNDEDTDTTPVSDNDADTQEPNDEDSDTIPIPDEDADTDPIIEMEEGIYLGIIGFNDDLTTKPIKRLTDTNKNEFKNFIGNLQQKNYTALYWADYNALDMMRKYTISPDLQLKKVALVTFTDGLDNQSLALDEFNPGPYDSQADYMNAIHTMIMDEDGIHGQPVTAYSIGLKGSDVTDDNKFKETLEKLASESENEEEKYVFQVTDMSEVENHFAAIADSLYQVSTTINVGVYIPGGYDNGQVIRYTFDNVSAAVSSNLYIEATYHRSGSSRTLENINYQGFMDGSSTISSSATGPHGELYFQFNDLKYSDGSPVSQSEILSKSRLWKQTSSGGWDGESEMNMEELPPVVNEDKSSALIMLVLDSTTSLGSDFTRMQSAAKNFIETLVNGGSGGSSIIPVCAAENHKELDTTTNTCKCITGYHADGDNCVEGLPECSTSNTGPCKDSSTGYIWSAKASTTYTWQNAIDYCTGLNSSNYGGFSSGWHLPTISELKTFFAHGSNGEEWNQKCGVSDSCLSYLDCWNEYKCATAFGVGSEEESDYWSSSERSDNTSDAWYEASSNYDTYWQVYYSNKTTTRDVRCVRTFPECSASNTGPCYDSTSHLTWSKKADTIYTWSDAGTYCNNLTEGGYSDWRLPNISELRTLIKNCSGTQMPGGSCGVIDTGNSSTSCLSSSCQGEDCYSCSYDSTGGHSKFGETGFFWSSSTMSDNTNVAWSVSFYNGRVGKCGKDDNDDYYVRCVR